PEDLDRVRPGAAGAARGAARLPGKPGRAQALLTARRPVSEPIMRGLLNGFSDTAFGSKHGSFRETQIRRGPGRSVFEYRGRLRGRGVAHLEQVVRHRLSAALEASGGAGLFPRTLEGAGAGTGLCAHS